ncbi:hypothetical protein QNI16_21715 [Cytophagaceae bacterium YF14B1]|uniref:Uncharacterized protein n=1 Tax=Xanthocytophaga flava TaxID=3048013 RepID=A0AAE3QTU7_9BACT|nr:hypothetical protein [Xanthocytophaga flavus]MDJ1483131.1 hypothetical protein [Xanthocytophaga flavus]
MTHSILIQLNESQANTLLEILQKGLAAIEDERYKASGAEIKQIMTAAQLREALHICRSTEIKLRNKGILKARFLGKLVYYMWDEVVEGLKRNDDALFPVSKKLRPARRTR